MAETPKSAATAPRAVNNRVQSYLPPKYLAKLNADVQKGSTESAVVRAAVIQYYDKRDLK